MVENARAGTMARFGLDHASLAPSHPALVYTSISGFGQSGPYAGHPATDTAMQAFTGLAKTLSRELAADGVTSLLVEGGATVAQEFHDAGLVDRYVMYVANTDPDEAAAAMRERWQTHVVDATAIGNDVRVILEPSGRR